MKTKRAERIYLIDTDGDLRITVKLGNGQLGSASITAFDDRLLWGSNNPESVVAINDEYLGTGLQARGKVKTLGALVRDVNPFNNDTSVAISINGTDLLPVEETTDEDREQVNFNIKIIFE